MFTEGASPTHYGSHHSLSGVEKVRQAAVCLNSSFPASDVMWPADSGSCCFDLPMHEDSRVR